MTGGHSLLDGLIDYAGLFPPAALDLDGARDGYRRAREHPHGGLVDRFVCPAALLGELGEDWPVALVCGADELGSLADPGPARVTVVELRPGADADAVAAARALFPAATVYVEVPPADAAALDAVAAAGARAKLRCGGERVPSAEEVAATLLGCVERGIALKGTAGLHHAVAAPGRHGFLNLLAAAGLADAAPIADHDAASFDVRDGRFAWRGREVDPALARERFTGFGSCSFEEPVADLVALGALQPVGVSA